MNGKQAKLLRKMMRQRIEVGKSDAIAFKKWVRELPFKSRIKLAWKIILRAY